MYKITKAIKEITFCGFAIFYKVTSSNSEHVKLVFFANSHIFIIYKYTHGDLFFQMSFSYFPIYIFTVIRILFLHEMLTAPTKNFITSKQ